MEETPEEIKEKERQRRIRMEEEVLTYLFTFPYRTIQPIDGDNDMITRLFISDAGNDMTAKTITTKVMAINDDNDPVQYDRWSYCDRRAAMLPNTSIMIYCRLV